MHSREISTNTAEREWPRALSVEPMMRMGARYLGNVGRDTKAMIYDAH